jgi:Fe-S-cluster containining protein
MSELHASAPALAAELERRAQAWIQEHAQGFPGNLATGILGQSESDQARFEDFANDAPCPALNPATGLCDVYAARPITCRVFGPPVQVDSGPHNQPALAHCELCFLGASETEIAACEMPIPHALEAGILRQIPDPGETVVAFALLP